MKTQATAFLLLVCSLGFAQTPINKSYPVQAGQTLVLTFDYPELIKISTWDKNEVSITGSVSINGGEHDDAFELSSSSSGSTLSIQNKIKNMKDLPHRVTIYHNGQKISFKSKDEFKKYQQEHGKNYKYTSWGVDLDIELEIKVPKNMETRVVSTYGVVEVKDFAAPLSVEATYGAVDAALFEKNVGELKAETNFGQIYTNLDLKLSGSEFEDFHTVVSAKPGSGPRYSFESKYGNVYLRKQ